MDLSSVAIDTETTGVGYKDTPFLATTYAMGEDGVETKAWRLPDNGGFTAYINEFDTWIFHNSKFDLGMLLKKYYIDWPMITTRTIHDTECLAHLYDENKPKGLKFLAKHYLGMETDEDEIIKAERRKLKLTKKDGYDKLPIDIVVPYALKDAEFTYRLFEYFMHKDPWDNDWPRKLYETEMELTLVLLKMELAGMKLDMPYVEATDKDLGLSLLKLKQTLIDYSGNSEFNPNSWKQILEVFKVYGYDEENTDKETLQRLAPTFYFAQLLLEYRKNTKLKSTYFDAMLEENVDGIIHPNYRQHGTRTGRLSSGEVDNA